MNECDLVIIGGGPAGLSAAITAASEGLETTIVDSRALGGQARESSLIENYPGFPNGISGQDLATKMIMQATAFEANVLCPAKAVGISVDGDKRIVTLDDGDVIACRAVLISSGLSYKRHDGKNIGQFRGRGVSYGAPTVNQAKAQQCFAVIGGANSAGQAAMYLSAIKDCTVKILVRGNSLEKSMSEYLIRRIRATPNIEVLLNTEVTEAMGDEVLRQVRIVTDGTEKTLDIHGLYIFIGAQPKTYWLNGVVEKDPRGFIPTGRLIRQRAAGHEPHSFETSLPGVFCAGDVRLDSTKRVGAAVGEGSVAVQMMYVHLAEQKK